MSEPTITLAVDDLSTDAVVTFPADANTRDSVWLTVDTNRGGPKYSVNIVKTDEGLVVDVYLLDREMDDPVASTYVFDQDALDIIEGESA